MAQRNQKSRLVPSYPTSAIAAIDPGRITAAAKGAAEPAYDNATAEGKAKNRRATILVTLVSGT